MYHIALSKEIKQNCPEFRGAAVFAEVTNTPYCEGLWQEIATFTPVSYTHLTLPTILRV